MRNKLFIAVLILFSVASATTINVPADYSTSVSGTGSFMSIVFSASASGVSSLTYSNGCELADPDDNSIEIKGFGEGVVNAQ